MVAPRCDACGRFFSMLDSSASITMITPDSAYTSETYESLCGRCVRANETASATRAERERCARVAEALAEALLRDEKRFGEAGSGYLASLAEAQARLVRNLAEKIRQG